MPNDLEHYEVAANPGAAGERLDRVLSNALPFLSRTRVKALIEDGRVTAEGMPFSDPAYRVRGIESFVVDVPEATPAEPQAQDIALDIVYEDADLVVIDKPAGMVVHPAPGSVDSTLVNALLAHCGESLSGIGGVRRPGIVHRLDKDTSGLLVAAKNDAAHRHLAAQFAEHSVDRAYLALAWGVPVPAVGRVEGNIGRSSRDRKKMAVRREGGKAAATRYRTVRAFGRIAALLECRLDTGRTHQIRVHLASRGHPLVGDSVYGGGRTGAGPAAPLLRSFPRQALHAAELGFDPPRGGERLLFRSRLPADFKGLLDDLEALETPPANPYGSDTVTGGASYRPAGERVR